MSDHYPVPSYAATIWMAGDNIMLGFEETRTTPGRTVSLPATERGLLVALQLLRERMALPSAKIGSKAEPTQFDLQEEIKKCLQRQKLSDDPEAALKELGF